MVSVMINKIETHWFEMEVCQLNKTEMHCNKTVLKVSDNMMLWIGMCDEHTFVNATMAQVSSKVLNRYSQASTALYKQSVTHVVQMVRYSKNVNSKIAMHNKCAIPPITSSCHCF